MNNDLTGKDIDGIEKVDAFLTNPDNIKIGLDTAKSINDKLNNWFTIEQLVKKMKYKKFESALEIMNLLCLLGFCYREEKLKGVIKYKITLNNQLKVILLKEERSEAVAKVEYLDRMIAKYS